MILDICFNIRAYQLLSIKKCADLFFEKWNYYWLCKT
jgi:hypothetical protein